MTVTVRDFRPEDAAAVVRVRRATLPYLPTTEAAVRFEVASAHPAKKERLLIAEENGEVIGAAQTFLAHDSPEPGQSSVNPHVHPAHRGHGAGSRLLKAAEEHLAAHGATSVYTWVLDEPDCRAFARRQGYLPTRTAHFLRLDLTDGTLPDRLPVPPGAELRTALDYADDPRPLFEADAEVTCDEPGDISADFTDYQDWIGHTWNNPRLDRGLTTVVVVDGQVAAFTAALTDDSAGYLSGMTGTRRAYRGRGLAKLAKSDSLHRAREAGRTEAFTGNDAENAPMLAINQWFGYQIRATEVRHVRRLG